MKYDCTQPQTFPNSWFGTAVHDWRIITVGVSMRSSCRSVLEMLCRRCGEHERQHSLLTVDYWDTIKSEQPEDQRR